MKQLTLELDKNVRSVYLRVAAAIRSAIKNGQLKPSETLPSARELAKILRINRHTVMSAYQELIAQGWLESIERKHYRVVCFLPVEASQPKSNHKQPLSRFDWPTKKAFESLTASNPAIDFKYNFAGGMPDLNLFPFKEFKYYMNQSLLKPSIEDLGYANNRGSNEFIQQLKTYLRRARSITDKEIIAVNGTQEALYLIAQLLLRPGDRVAVEPLGYRPAWNAFKSAGAELIAVKQHAKGIDIQHLKEQIIANKIKLIYLTPLHQYPTTVTLPVDERMAIYSLAVKHRVIIVEDDYDHEFHYDSQPLAPMAANDPNGQVIYLASFSKIMFPGSRVGCMAIDPSLAPALLNYRSVVNHKPNCLVQAAIAGWMKNGAFERHLRKMTKIYQQRRAALVEILDEYQQQGVSLDYHLPAGGMAIWLDIKSHASELETYCLENNIYLQTEAQFHLVKKDNQNRFIRLGFAGMDSQKTRQGLAVIFEFIKAKGK
jgi:GntR family transcriptional regulator / MocR family aminotransferase